jgi:hypothetical protein
MADACVRTPETAPLNAHSIFDQRHLLVLGYVWELPFAKNLKGPASTVLSGWSFQGIVTFASGNPFDGAEHRRRTMTDFGND